MDTLRDKNHLEELWEAARHRGRCGSELGILARQARLPDRPHRLQGRLAVALAATWAPRYGYALSPPTEPSLFDALRSGKAPASSTIADIRDAATLSARPCKRAQPEIVFHLAAQPLVRYSYREPVETYATNVMGTVNCSKPCAHTPGVRAVVNVTTDKCYENREWVWGYRENEPMGGYDPYSSSKGCAELVTAAYRDSFLDQAGVASGQCPRRQRHRRRRLGRRPARSRTSCAPSDAGTDAQDPLAPSHAALAACAGAPVRLSDAWPSSSATHGPGLRRPGISARQTTDARPVHVDRRIARADRWPGARWQCDAAPQPHEAGCLRLDSCQARRTSSAGARAGICKPHWPRRWTGIRPGGKARTCQTQPAPDSRIRAAQAPA